MLTASSIIVAFQQRLTALWCADPAPVAPFFRYVLIKGEVDIKKNGVSIGQAVTGATMGEEVALSVATAYGATHMALDHCDLYCLSCDDIELALKHAPDVLAKMREIAEKRILKNAASAVVRVGRLQVRRDQTQVKTKEGAATDQKDHVATTEVASVLDPQAALTKTDQETGIANTTKNTPTLSLQRRTGGVSLNVPQDQESKSETDAERQGEAQDQAAPLPIMCEPLFDVQQEGDPGSARSPGSARGPGLARDLSINEEFGTRRGSDIRRGSIDQSNGAVAAIVEQGVENVPNLAARRASRHDARVSRRQSKRSGAPKVPSRFAGVTTLSNAQFPEESDDTNSSDSDGPATKGQIRSSRRKAKENVSFIIS